MPQTLAFDTFTGKPIAFPPGTTTEFSGQDGAGVRRLPSIESPNVRKFESGATRDTDTAKLDYEGFLSPAVLQRYAEFMHKNRVQRDGKLRDSDNWQKGIPLDVYMKSMTRHFFEVWGDHRTNDVGAVDQDSLCALLFNVFGYLFETLRGPRPEAPSPTHPFLTTTTEADKAITETLGELKEHLSARAAYEVPPVPLGEGF